MSVIFYITPVDPKAWEDPKDTREKPTSNLHIDRENFRAALLQRFSKAIEHDSKYWILYSEDHQRGIECYLSRVEPEGYNYISFSPYGFNFIEFILWFRRFVSLNHTLYLFNSSSWDRLILTENTTFEEVKNFTGWTDR